MRSWMILALVTSLAATTPGHAQDAPLLAGSGGVPVPKKSHYVPPEYPAEAIERGLRGIVILELVIDVAGKVASAEVVRSVPPFDDAALKAARQWEYEATKVDGKAVSVRLTVPITFSLKLPEVSRQSGIPELRQGANPRYPAASRPTDSGSVTAEIILQTDGTVAEARIMKGDSPWSEALLQAVGTWRFAPEVSGAIVSFRVEADFVGGNPPRVGLRLSGLRREEGAAAAPAPAPTLPVPESVAPSPAPTEAVAPPPFIEAAKTPPPAAAPPPSAAPSAAAGPPEKAPQAPVEEIVAASTQQAAAVAPSPEPPVVGASSVRDVTLSEGVPDLVKGRRPVPPPLARMAGTEGVVEVRFSVDAAGGTAVQGSAGAEVLRTAAEGVVASWSFRRTTTRRLYLAAEISFKADSAAAKVRPQE